MILQLPNLDLRLLPDRAAFAPLSATLFVADIHLGKASAFATGGIPLNGSIVERSTAHDLARLTALLNATHATSLIVLGDLLHARTGRDPHTLKLLAQWRAQHPDTHMLLVRGNHDQQAGDPPPDAGFECVDEPFSQHDLQLRHFPLPSCSGKPTLAGHLHPAVRLTGPADRTRAACFWLSGQQLVLPAFGTFTGCTTITPTPGDRVIVVNDGHTLAEVPLVQRAGARVR